MGFTRVLIVDSHPITADSLSLSLDQYDKFVAVACYSYADVPESIQSFEPDIIVINVHQDDFAQGLRALEQSKQVAGDQLAILLAPRSIVLQEMLTLDAVEAGAQGVLIQEELDLQQLVKALTEVGQGRNLIDLDHLRAALSVRRVNETAPHDSLAGAEKLTRREQEVGDLLVAGHSTAQIAAYLSISERTVQSHISNILVKLQVRTRVEAVLQLYQWHKERRQASEQRGSSLSG